MPKYWGKQIFAHGRFPDTATQNGQIVTLSGNSVNLHIIDEPSVSSTDRPHVLYIFEKVFERASK